MNLICKCGEIIPDANIDYSNRCNEEGEDYFEASAHCDKCKADYDTSGWGEINSTDEAKEYLIDGVTDLRQSPQ
jgi:hypothetical protein